MIRQVASSTLMLIPLTAGGCTGSDAIESTTAYFESLGAEIEVNDRGEVVTLDLTDTRITDAALRQVRRLPSLCELRLQSCRGLTDDSLQSLHDLENLKVLILSLNQQITDSGVEHLSSVPNLEDLVLVGCSVTDDGVTHLHDRRSLRLLKIEGGSFTEAEVKSLTQALPDCEISID